MELIVFGLNHRTAPLDVRERWALSPAQNLAALRRLHGEVANSEHLILSTCNRTEFYSSVPLALSPLSRPGDVDGNGDAGDDHAREESVADPEALLEHATRGAMDFYQEIHRLVADSKTGEHDLDHFYCFRQKDALAHLFRLAGGLDSMIVGESQILKQIKDAYTVAQEAKTAGKFFHRLFPMALKVGKRVRSSTSISDGCITPGQAALDLARGVHKELTGRSVMVMGSGKIAGLSVQAISDAGIADCFVVNRTAARAHELVDRIGVGTAVEWSRLEEVLARVDIVISSTGSIKPVVSRQRLERIQSARLERPLVAIDLAIPRDFEPEAASAPGVHLYNIDDLNQVIQDNVARRHAQIPLAEKIIREELLSFQGQMIYRQIDPVLKHMSQRFEQIRMGVLQKYLGQFPAEHHELVDQMSNALLRKLLNFPIAKLKSLRDVQNLNDTEVQFLRRLFLTDPPESAPKQNPSEESAPGEP